MNIFYAMILGALQGITEFFPISSSGHLVLAQSLLGLKEPQLAFDIFLHLGTLASILIFFRKDIVELFSTKRRVLIYLAAASVPTFIMAVLFKDIVEEYFGMPKMVGYMLMITGAWLALAAWRDRVKKNAPPKAPDMIRSVIIGIAQGIAIMPGVSRSGATIATGMLSGLDKEEACRFSFLLAIPAIAGASFFKARKIAQGITGAESLYFIIGGIVAMITGIAAIRFLMKFVKEGRLQYFSVYCFAAGLIAIIKF